MRNPLTEFTGPEFLVFFAILIVIVAAICWRRKRTQDSSTELPPLDVPDQIDPYDIAYLRGGENELTRVLIVRLIERKYLRIVAPESKWLKKSDSRIQQDPEHPDVADLLPIERAGFEWFESARTAEDVFGKSRSSTPLPSSLTSHAVKYEQKLRAARLLTSDALKSQAQKNIAFGIALVLLVGFARLLIGIARNRPVGFLVLMSIAGVVVIVSAGRTRPPELARTGVPRASQDPMELAEGLPLRRGLEPVTRRRHLRLRGSFRDRNESAEPYVPAKQCRRLLWIRWV